MFLIWCHPYFIKWGVYRGYWFAEFSHFIVWDFICEGMSYQLACTFHFVLCTINGPEFTCYPITIIITTLFFHVLSVLRDDVCSHVLQVRINIVMITVDGFLSFETLQESIIHTAVSSRLTIHLFIFQFISSPQTWIDSWHPVFQD